ncbi:hypothetical protein RclHR1_14690002 [Rhizophagus clarus]|uniref:F-box domain-containing protein n=1 Tax=Rhizophagus clarus TaxID=94130 RepID=A0A2Z6QDA9_9GLOM|nr:hypothetical protein RclHR1_14690002 [Rhizophagus clarus]
MYQLDKDILNLIFENLKVNLYPCLLVNKTWCETIVPIIWKNPWNDLIGSLYFKREKSLLKVIVSHIPDEKKVKEIFYYLKINQTEIDSFQRPLFDYISFCKHLNLGSIMRIINNIIDSSERLTVQDEIFNLFVNENIRITHLYIPNDFNYQIHLIPGARSCFSKIKFLKCSTNINNNILIGLIEMCKSIKELKLVIERFNNNYEIIKLIEAQKRLVRVHFELSYYNSLFPQDGSFGKVLENSLIKHSNTIQYFTAHRPISTEILSSLINLKGLELRGNFLTPEKWKNLENASLPSLQFLKLNGLPFNCIVSLIKNTSGSLVEIELCDYFYYSENEYKRIIQVIYQNCPNLKYFTFSPQVTDILETEKLLITCQFLNGLHIINRKYIDWDSLFKVLIKASPVRLYKFYFEVNEPIKLESLKYFIDNWKGRRPILLKIKCMYTGIDTEMRNLLKKYLLEGLIDTLYEW